MAHFHEVTEHSLRDLSRRATMLYLSPHSTPCSPTEAVIKTAGAFTEAPLTNEHVRRVCEMTYHDIFEQTFRGSAGGDRVVTFEPPDAEKVATALRVRRLDSFAKAAAASPTSGAGMDKSANAPLRGSAPRSSNVFSVAMDTLAPDTSSMRKEARAALQHLHGQLKEAVASLQVNLTTADSTEKVAFVELLDGAVRAVRQGPTATEVTSACLELAKHAGTEDESILSGLATDLLVGLDSRGVLRRGEKVASLSGLAANGRHPLRPQVEKVAELRSYKTHGAVALQDLRAQVQRVEQELKDARYW